MTQSPQDLVLFLGHGSIGSPSELPEFLRSVRRGRAAPSHLVEELERRYALIGGSPLLDATQAQGALLERRLQTPVAVAMRLWHPFIAEVLAKLAARPEPRPDRLCVLPAAPFSVHVYTAATREALAGVAAWQPNPPRLVAVEPWGAEPLFIEAHARRIGHALAERPGSHVVLTAHSLPVAVVRQGDPYQEQVEQTAAALREALGRPCTLAYQSQGADGGEWLGPDLPTALRRARAQGERRVVLAPIGFIAEHIETLYDLDVEARGLCDELGLDLSRVPALGSEPLLIEAMAQVVGRALS